MYKFNEPMVIQLPDDSTVIAIHAKVKQIKLCYRLLNYTMGHCMR
jgi:hypothetical protein